MKTQFTQDLQHILNNTDELSSIVNYRRYEDGSEHEVKAVVDLREFEDLASEGRIALNTAVAYCELPFEPVKYDEISHEGKLYKVEEWSKRGVSYKLVLVSGKRPTNMHTKGRFR